MNVLIVYVPLEAAERVKQAMFDAGAGKLGAYDHCCWQVEGMGQFRPLAGSQPHLGQQGKVEQVTELRLELLCPKVLLEPVIKAMKDVHPYESPAYHHY